MQRRRGQRLHRRLARRTARPDEWARAYLRRLRPHRLIHRGCGNAHVLARHRRLSRPQQRRRARARRAVAAARVVNDLRDVCEMARVRNTHLMRLEVMGWGKSRPGR